jgi:PAS domain S-box-containing protein
VKIFTLSKKAIYAILLILLPIAVTFTYTYKKNKEFLVIEEIHEMVGLANAYEGQVYLFLESARRRAQDFASDGFIRVSLKRINRGELSMVAPLNEHLTHNKITLDHTIHTINVISADGRIAASTRPENIGRNLRKEDFFLRGLKGPVTSGKIATGHRSAGSGSEAHIVAAAPVLGAEKGAPLGMVANNIHLLELNKLMTGKYIKDLGALSWKHSEQETFEVYLVGNDGLMLTDSRFVENAIMRQKNNTLPVRECIESGSEIGEVYTNYRGVKVVGASMCLPAMGWTLVAESEYGEVMAVMDFMRRSAITTGLIVAALITALFFLYLKSVVRPLRALAGAADGIASGDYDITIPIRTTDEIGALSRSFNSMAREIKGRTSALKESEARLTAVLDNSAAIIYVKDREGRYTLVNRRFEALFNIGLEEIKGKTDHDVFPVDTANTLRTHDQKVLDMDTTLQFNETMDQADGLHTYFTIKFPLLDDLKRPYAVCGISTDITLSRKMEEEMQKAERLESIGLLAGGIAHDFNNLMTGILARVSVVLSTIAPDDINHKRLTAVEKAVLRAADLTRQILTFSKGGAPVKRVVSVAELIDEAAGFALRGSNVKYEATLPEDLSAINADPGQINQMINNLIINATHAMPEGGVIDIRAENFAVKETGFLTLEKGDYVLITFTDHGVGIPPDEIHRIFDPFFTTKDAGSGLGLATTYSIVKNHGGHIVVESEEGTGSTFFVYLPASDEEPKLKKEEAEELVKGSGRVLIMDDEEMIREVAEELLKIAGYEVSSAADGGEAVSAYREALSQGTPFDVVIMDLTIPGGKGGKETIKELKAIDPEVKAIVSSGYSNDPIMADFKKYGFSGVVAKPYKLSELSMAVRSAIEDKTA